MTSQATSNSNLDKQLAAKPTEPQQPPLPISTKNLIRLLLIIIILLAFLAGYYQAALRLEKKKYAQIEDKFVRVRQILGAEKTQELINQSHSQEN